jgi:hypothetical protein
MGLSKSMKLDKLLNSEVDRIYKNTKNQVKVGSKIII